jgi:poly(ADP-ribose) glycohydrolase
MEDNEALAFIGFKRYFDYSGYSSSTKFEGHVKVEYKKTKDFQAAEYIAAIDAIKFKPGGKEQYVKNLIDREILKAYVGFSALPMEGKIITGGWGCGVYNGDIQTKLLIQWIAASLADK